MAYSAYSYSHIYFRPTICFFIPVPVENPEDFLGSVKRPPGGGEDSPSFAYPVNVPVAQKMSMAPAKAADTENYWTAEKKLRAKCIMGLALSILTSPLLFPLIPAFYFGRKLNNSFQRRDLDKLSDRLAVRRRILQGDLNFSQITKLYNPETIEKYRLLDSSGEVDPNNVEKYSKFRLLYQNSQKIRKQKKFDLKNIDIQYDKATSGAVSIYRWKRAGIAGKQTLLTIGNILLVVASVMAAREGDYRGSAVMGATAADMTVVQGIEAAGDVATWGKLKDEYSRKIEPWNRWRENRKEQVEVAYQDAEAKIQKIFIDTILNKSDEVSANEPPCSQPEEVQSEQQAEPLFFTTEEQNGKTYPICNISYEPLEIGGAVSTPCGHTFNRKSIGAWLENNNTCPCCRHSGIEQKDLKDINEQDLNTSPNLANYTIPPNPNPAT